MWFDRVLKKQGPTVNFSKIFSENFTQTDAIVDDDIAIGLV